MDLPRPGRPTWEDLFKAAAEEDSARIPLHERIRDDCIEFSPFTDDGDASIALRKVRVRKARKQHTCDGFETEPHPILPGEHYRHEQALIDSDYWGKYKLCMPCMHRYLKNYVWNDEATN